ncbi:MAG: MBOAT family protein [Phycisphaerales bacterium]|nr:MBOAT family protein [Phycisphaerales bacterium]
MPPALAMVFSSQTFLFFFLPVVLGVYVLLGIGPALRNLWLLLASLIFYTWGGGDFVLVLLISIAGNWVLGLLAHQARGTGSRLVRNGSIAISVMLNIGILAWFKYANFFVDQINDVGTRMGMGSISWEHILLPIGISFFTFQATSYVIDVARGQAKVMRNPIDFALYVSLFPQLIAGPIVRYHEIASQLESRPFDWDNVSSGMLRFVHGLVKKVVIADSVGVIADAAFASETTLSAGDAWIGLLAYTLQIYFDFSGYSDMAIGMGRMFGFRLPENFKRPYSAVCMTDFWRRWHVTLSNWFRDYVYIPLGGSRCSKARTYGNLVIVFLLTGFWHGANWTFIAWGIYNGFWLICDRLTGQTRPDTLGWIPLRRLLTFFVVMMGWVVFRAEDISHAGTYYQTLFDFPLTATSGALESVLTSQSIFFLVLGSVIALLPGRISTGRWLDESTDSGAVAYRIALSCLFFPLALIFVISGTFSPFLYFQF